MFDMFIAFTQGVVFAFLVAIVLAFFCTATYLIVYLGVCWLVRTLVDISDEKWRKVLR